MRIILIFTTMLAFGATVQAEAPAQKPAKAQAVKSVKKATKAVTPEAKASPAAEEPVNLFPLKIDADTEVEVMNYSEKSDVFELSIKKEPGVGPNFATPEALHKAIGTRETFAAFANKKRDLVGAELHLVDKLQLLDEDQVERRASGQK